MRRIVIPALLASLLAGPGMAQEPSVQSLIDGLLPEAARSRGIRLPAAPPAPEAAPGAAAPGYAPPPIRPRELPRRPPSPAPPPPPGDLTATTAPPGVAAVALMVTFATGSARIAPPAEAVLANLAAALASPQLARYRFRVEGHTDTVGPRPMNQALSERRAAAVRDWLVTHHGIDPRRLEAVGLGEQQPLVPTPDETPEARNRRVQVLNLGG